MPEQQHTRGKKEKQKLKGKEERLGEKKKKNVDVDTGVPLPS